MTYLLETVTQPPSKVILCSQENGGNSTAAEEIPALSSALKLVLETMKLSFNTCFLFLNSFFKKSSVLRTEKYE